ncbi:MAG: DUF309 domain-containing protein [Pseudomonadota bacterium]|nr:DUF309 domain-containing protein [Pseudomonadota bacterium]
MTPAPHIPGQNARPPEGSIAPGWEEGLAQYRAGYFWEAHEAWEPVWMQAAPNSEHKALVQAAIQLANGNLKEVMGQHRAATRILDIVRDQLARAGQGARVDWARDEADKLESRLKDGAL